MRWLSLQRAIDKWLKQLSYGRKTSTIRNLRNHLKRLQEYFDDDIQGITFESYHKWLQMAKNKWKGSTVAKTHRTATRLFLWANLKDAKKIRNIHIKISWPKIETYSLEQINLILKWCFNQKKSDWRIRAAAFILILSCSGMRGGECLRLKWHDFDQNTAMFHLRTTKTGVSRFSAIHEQIVPFLLDYKIKMQEKLEFNSQWVFPSFIHPNNHITYNAITTKMNNEISKELDFHINPKKFRSTLVKLVIESGGGYEKAAAIVGHSDIGVTQKHYHRISMNQGAKDAHSKALEGFEFK